ncbi:MAG TPA: cyanophycin synthetase, partial [Flavisolibacter sp.]
GIIKHRVPVVIGERRSETDAVFREVAEAKEAPLFFAEDLFSVQHFALHNTHIAVDVLRQDTGDIQTYLPDLPGIYQCKNLVTTLQSVELLREHFEIGAVGQAIANTARATGLLGRWEVLGTQPLVIADVAHNADGITQLVRHIGEMQYKQLRIVLGMVNDKDTSILSLLPKHATYYFTQAHIPRALDAVILQREAEKEGLKGIICDDVNKALQQAVSTSDPEDLVIVCGSIFLVAEVERDQYVSAPSRSSA